MTKGGKETNTGIEKKTTKKKTGRGGGKKSGVICQLIGNSSEKEVSGTLGCWGMDQNRTIKRGKASKGGSGTYIESCNEGGWFKRNKFGPWRANKSKRQEKGKEDFPAFNT